MVHVFSGVPKFQNKVFPDKKTTLQKFVNGQKHEVLCINCSDSRLDPSVVTQPQRGDLFMYCNTGNVVALHSKQSNGLHCLFYTIESTDILCYNEEISAFMSIEPKDAAELLFEQKIPA